jgi:flagellar L-ring protein precursor FlgH
MSRTFPAAALALATLLAGCAGAPPSIVSGPLIAPPLQPPESIYLERPPNGAIYQAHLQTGSLFSNERRPQRIGDTVKVEIAEALKASQKLNTDTSRNNQLAVKGPGGSQAGGLLGAILNADASASGSDAYKGQGQTENTASFSAQMAASVINVLPNGHLVIAGERSMAFNGGVNTLRFSGVVDPRDIRLGNVVVSADVVNARLEVAGKGELSEAAQRSWLQRVLTQSLAVW